MNKKNIYLFIRCIYIIYVLLFCNLVFSQEKTLLPNGGFSPTFSLKGKYLFFYSSTPNTIPTLWFTNLQTKATKQIYNNFVKFFITDNEEEIILLENNELLFFNIKSRQKSLFFKLPQNTRSIAISLDKSYLAYCEEKGKFCDLMIYNFQTKKQTQLTKNFYVREIIFSNDNKKIVFTIGIPVSKAILIYDLEKKSQQFIYGGEHKSKDFKNQPITERFAGNIAFSPTGNKIAFTIPLGHRQYYLGIYNFKTKKIKIYDSLKWDGSTILFKDKNKIFYGEVSNNLNSIAEFNLKNTDTWQLTPPGLQAWEMNFANNKIAFIGIDENSYVPEIMLLNLQNNKITKITPSFQSFFRQILSPDGKKIALMTIKKGIIQVFIYDITTKKIINTNLNLDEPIFLKWNQDSNLLLFFARGYFSVYDTLQNKVINSFLNQCLVDVTFSNEKNLVYFSLFDGENTIITQFDFVKDSKKILYQERSKYPNYICLIDKILYFTWKDKLFFLDNKNQKKEVKLKYPSKSNKILTMFYPVYNQNKNLLLLNTITEKNKIRNWEVFLVNTNDFKTTNIHFETLKNIQPFSYLKTFPPMFSPSGNIISFSSLNDNNILTTNVLDLNLNKIIFTKENTIFPYPASDDNLYLTLIKNQKEKILQCNIKTNKCNVLKINLN